MIAKDYLFKTIEFGKVDTVTKYMVTKLQPIFPGNVYVEHPDKKFIYTSYEEMVTDIKATLNYTDDQIATLQIEQLNSYYDPLYTIKWYIGGLYDFMHSDVYINSTDKHALLMPEIDDSLISEGQNNLLGYVFPERMMKLIRNKPINRIRLYVKDAPINKVSMSELRRFDHFQWVTTRQFISPQGISYGIKVEGKKEADNTYIWVVYAATPNDTAVSSEYVDDKYYYIGIACNNISPTAQVAREQNKPWPYSWTKIAVNDEGKDNENLPTQSYVDLGTFTYNIYFRYNNSGATGALNEYPYDKNGNYYTYIGILLTFSEGNNTSLSPDNPKNYSWHKLRSLQNIIPYISSDKHKMYYLYLRFYSANNTLTDTLDSTTQELVFSFYNSTNKITSFNDSYNVYDNFEGKLKLNIFKNLKYRLENLNRYVWIKFADKIDDSDITQTTNHETIVTVQKLHDYVIYKSGNTIKYRKYLFIAFDKGEREHVDNMRVHNNNAYHKIDLTQLESTYNYNIQVFGEDNKLTSKIIYIKFSEYPPKNINETTDSFDINTTNYINISLTDKSGNLHNGSNTNLDIDDFQICIPIREYEQPTTYTKDRYVYFTYSNDLNDVTLRSQYPQYQNNEGTKLNKTLFGYAYDQIKPLSNAPTIVDEVDETSREITLYKAKNLNAITEVNISKLTSINVPYNTMGKYSVFKFDPVVLSNNEYLIIGGNRDNICTLVPNDDASFTENIDYATKNYEYSYANQDRPQVNGTQVMYYKGVNFNTIEDWTPVYDRYLPIDIGCGYATATGEVQLSTKSYKEIIQETKANDAATLAAYKAAHANDDRSYKAPNYDLYINLTYKFAKIIDGNIDYMPLFNRYKIKYKFKNENQKVLLSKVFDTSLITPDGSIYYKPNEIVIDGQTYGKTSYAYTNYFEEIEGKFVDTLQETDKGIEDNDYDVAYFQYDNMLRKIYENNPDDINGINYPEEYYNYKYLADEHHKEALPVLCEVTISAYETQTALYTRTIPVSLAAYSLVEITDDYIKTTVSKVENDYIYGLTQRTSRIEQYADRISMAVQNVGQGLYSHMQMTEDKILMEVVDASKNIGSMFNLTAQKIEGIVYDISRGMHSRITQEANKISMEVTDNFRRAGIYLTADTAEIDAPSIKLRGDRTKIYGTLQIKDGTGEGIVMLDSSNADRIHVTVEELPHRNDLTSKTETLTKIMYQGSIGSFTAGENFSKNIFNNIGVISQDISTDSRHVRLLGVTISGEFQLKDSSGNTTDTVYFENILDIDNITFDASVSPYKMESINYSAKNILESQEIEEQLYEAADDTLYGAGLPNSTFQWEYNGNTITNENNSVTIDTNYSGSLPVLKYSTNIGSANIVITNSNDTIFSNRSVYFGNSEATTVYTLSGTEGSTIMTASYSVTSEGATYTDEISVIVNVTQPKSFNWKLNGSICESCDLYYDITSNNLPKIEVNGIAIGSINVTFNYHGLPEFLEMKNNGQLSITTRVPQNDNNPTVDITATYNGDTTITKNLIITIKRRWGGMIEEEQPKETNGWVIDSENGKHITLKTKSGSWYNEWDNSSTSDNANDIFLEDNYAKMFVKLILNSNTIQIKYGLTKFSASSLNSFNAYVGHQVFNNIPVQLNFNASATTDYVGFGICKYGGVAYDQYNTVKIQCYDTETLENIQQIYMVFSGSDLDMANTINDVPTQSKIYDSTDTLEAFDKNKAQNVVIENNILYVHLKSSQYLGYRQASGEIGITTKLYIVYQNSLHISSISLLYIDKGVFKLLHYSAVGEITTYATIRLAYKYVVTNGTRIAKNGMYSFYGEDSLLYLSTNLIEQRLGNNGLRLTRENSQSYAGSAGLEVYYGGNYIPEYQKNNDLWVSLFNYSPMLRFYATIDSNGWVFHMPEQQKTLNHATGVWGGGRSSWVWTTCDTINTKDTNHYHIWYYDIAYHRGNISIEQIYDSYHTNDNGAAYMIALPVAKYSAVHDSGRIGSSYRYYEVSQDIPIGFTITIFNSQYHSPEMDKSGGGRMEIGVPKHRLIIGVATLNYKFLYRIRANTNTNIYTYSTGGWSYGNDDNGRTHCNFLDAHGDYCAYIEMTDNNGNYLGDNYNANSFATFIWNGFIWKTSIDVNSNGQLGCPNES